MTFVKASGVIAVIISSTHVNIIYGNLNIISTRYCRSTLIWVGTSWGDIIKQARWISRSIHVVMVCQ